ncbi:hypothetical protein [uncultured Thiohalocapsa sp.]|uniref:hypothetical protein n=1 Tax=uncultured Thiohalocapsa sp. TaxID=768990 RepID=UPI0025D851E4|nr:hypothetical protein [uncultured Thiohalocapsa sp.]
MPKPIPLPRIRYHVVGQDDYMLNIEVTEDGRFTIDAGDYTSHKPTAGTLERAQAEALAALSAQLGPPRAHPAPAGASGFVAELTIGDGPTVHHYRFWEGALDAEPDIRNLVRALEVLG